MLELVWILTAQKTNKWNSKGKSADFQKTSILDECLFPCVYYCEWNKWKFFLWSWDLIGLNKISVLAESVLAELFLQNFSSDLVNVFVKIRISWIRISWGFIVRNSLELGVALDAHTFSKDSCGDCVQISVRIHCTHTHI